MNYKILFPLVFALFLLTSCDSTSSDHREVFEKLKANTAQITYTLDGKEFYAQQNIFSGEVNVSDKLLSMTLVDQFDGKTIISFGGDKWYQQIPVTKQLFQNDEVNLGVRMGRLIDKEKRIGEAFIMSEGEMTLMEFSKDRIVILIQGKAGKYSDFKQPDNLKVLKGTILYKRPVFHVYNITENALFSGINTSRK
jgi:hypothetical protein